MRKGRTAVKGVVSVETDPNGDLSGAAIVTDQGDAFDVVLDATGQRLAAEMAGQKVRALGTFCFSNPERVQFRADRFRKL